MYLQTVYLLLRSIHVLALANATMRSRALLPPLSLYRRILRVHRKKLDPESRLLGDLYVKSEFRAHKNIDNPLHIVSKTRRWTPKA